jgi:hypothetical protein
VPVTQPCPIGQIAPPGAVSADNCGCLPGFGGGKQGVRLQGGGGQHMGQHMSVGSEFALCDCCLFACIE